MKKRNPYLTAGLILTGVLTGVIILGFFWTPYDPNAMAAGPKLAAPSLAHLMGTDSFGRDIFSRVLKGAGTTFCIALATVAIGSVCGVALGAVTGYFGGLADDILMRLGDVLTAFPSILLALVVCALVTMLMTGENPFSIYATVRPRKNGKCYHCAGIGVHSQLCPRDPWRLRGAAGCELCEKRPAYGGLQRAHPLAAYPAQYGKRSAAGADHRL